MCSHFHDHVQAFRAAESRAAYTAKAPLPRGRLNSCLADRCECRANHAAEPLGWIHARAWHSPSPIGDERR
eukprot:431386-Pleurochrysis_carterae.AAC.1